MSTIAPRIPTALADRDGLAVIGRTLHDLRGIRFDNEPGGANPAPTPAEPVTPPAEPVTPPAPAAGVRFEDLDPTTQAHVRSLRDEARTNRERAEQAEQARTAAEAQRNAVLAALGLQADGQQTPPDPAALQATLAEREQAVAQTARENLVLRVAPTLNANADRLLDSRSFLNKLSSLKGDDRAGAEALVREFVENDASLKVTTAAASSGGTTHTGTTPPTGRANMRDAIGTRLAPAGR